MRRRGRQAHRLDMETTTANTPPSAPPLLTPAFVRLTVADLGYFTAAGVAIYPLPLYATGPLGAGPGGAGLAFGAFAVTALVLRPFAGRLADRLGRLPLLVGGALLCALVMAGTAVAYHLAVVVALRLLLGVAEAAFFVASLAALADLAPPSRRGEALSYNSLGLYLGLALGPPLGEQLVRAGGFAAAWYGAAGLAVAAALVALGIGETRSPGEISNQTSALVHRAAIPPALGLLASIVAMGAFLSLASLSADAVGLTTTSLPLLVYGGVVVACRVLFAKVPDRLPPLLLGATSLLAIAVGLAVVALWRTPTGLVAGTVLLGVGVSFSTPAFFSAIFVTARPSERGAASGTASAFIDLGLGLGPIALGLVAREGGIPSAFAVGAAIALLGAGWTVLLARRVGADAAIVGS